MDIGKKRGGTAQCLPSHGLLSPKTNRLVKGKCAKGRREETRQKVDFSKTKRGNVWENLAGDVGERKGTFYEGGASHNLGTWSAGVSEM